MELTQLYQFREVARMGNMTRAAEKLYVSQPALSKSIRLLEQELGVQLFDRQKNRLILNEAGETTLRHVEAALKELENLKDALNQGTKPSALKFCAHSSSSLRLFLPYFQTDHPEIEVTSEVVDETTITKHLRDGTYDVAFSFKPFSAPGIRSVPIAEEHVAISVPRDHPLAQQESISIYDLNGQDFFLYQYANSTFDFIDKLFQDANVAIRRHYEKDQMLYNRLIGNSRFLALTSTAAAQFMEYGSRRVTRDLKDCNAVAVHYMHFMDLRYDRVKLFAEWAKKNEDRFFASGTSQAAEALASE